MTEEEEIIAECQEAIAFATRQAIANRDAKLDYIKWKQVGFKLFGATSLKDAQDEELKAGGDRIVKTDKLHVITQVWKYGHWHALNSPVTVGPGDTLAVT